MSKELLARHRAVMPDWMSLYYDEPLELVSGSGRRVVGSDGVEYLDFFGGLLATMIGHSIPEISDAVASQAQRIMHSSTLYLISAQVELAEKIAAAAPVDDPRVFFVNSGSEAVETALALATSRRRSNQVLALRGSYHGRSFGTVGVTGIRGWSATALSPLQVSYVHSGYRLRSPFRALDEAAFVAACVEELQTIVDTGTAGPIAGFIYEPVQGAGGFATPPRDFFRAMQEVLAPYDVPFIADEVQSGWGRTGASFFATEHFGVRPQLLTFAKGLANGLSIGGVVGEAGFMNAAEANSISTAGGNPIAMSAANAVLDYIRDHELQRNADEMGRRLRAGLESMATRHPLIGEVRGLGLMIGVELVGPDGFSPAVAETTAVLEAARREQLLVGRGGLYGNVLRVTPPMTVTADEVDEALDRLERAFASRAAAV